MKKIILSILSITTLLSVTSCNTDFDTDVADIKTTNGDADFSTYVALGNSLTSGYRDGALYRDGQIESYPNIIAQQMQKAGGGSFTQPLTPNNTGGFTNLPGFRGKLTLQVVNGTLSPVPSTPTVVLDKLTETYNNMGVPGAKSFHLITPNYGNLSGISQGTANPYFVRFASSPSTSVLQDAIAKKPTFFTLWIGNNDVLSYASSGGIGTDQTGNIRPTTYSSNDITDPNVLAASIKTILDGMKSIGAKGVIANIPNVTSIPFFTTVPAKPLTSLTEAQISALNNWVYIDSLSAIFLGLIAIVGTLAGIYSIGYIGTEYREGHLDLKTYCNYYGFLHLFFFTMIISVITNNVILMWAAIEATTLSSAFLVGTYKQKTSLEAAWKYIIICSVGVAFGLYGTILTFSNGTNLLADPSQAIFWTEINQQAAGLNPMLMYLAFAFILVGFGTKCGLFPMHTWLSDAHSEAPSPVSAILSAVLLNCAMLVVLRYYILVSKAVGSTYPQTLLLVFGLLSVLVAALFIIVQFDIKRLLAYSSIENMGLISFAFGLGGPIGVFAGLLHTINHSLAKTLLFCASGNILLKYKTRDMNQVRGLWRVAPMTAVLFAGGALALGGIPPFNVFVSEFSIAVAGIYAGKTWLMVFCLILLTIVLAGLSLMVLKTVLGKKSDNVEVGDVNKISLVAMAILLLFMFIMGIHIAEPILQLLKSAVGIVLGSEQVSFGEMLVLPWQSLAQ